MGPPCTITRNSPLDSSTERPSEMAGVIDEEGQWERCNRCAGFTLIDDLLYEQPSEEFEYGRDICRPCNLAMMLGLSRTLPKEQWKDQLSADEAKRISDQVKRDIELHGMKVEVHHADGTITDESIPPKEKK